MDNLETPYKGKFSWIKNIPRWTRNRLSDAIPYTLIAGGAGCLFKGAYDVSVLGNYDGLYLMSGGITAFVGAGVTLFLGTRHQYQSE